MTRAGRIVCFAAAMWMLLPAAALARDALVVETEGHGTIEKCWVLVCSARAFDVPAVIVVGDILRLVAPPGEDDVTFSVHSITQERGGNCFLHDSPFRRRGGTVMLGKCRVVEVDAAPPPIAQLPDKLVEAIEFLGSISGMSEVCGLSPKENTTAALKWYERSIDLWEIVEKYTERVAPANEDARMKATLGFGIAAAQQSEEPERIWDDPQGCGTEMASEVDGIISEWHRYLR